ncbi:MAG: PKD domain-containing protein [Ginsengibacter sp.]
MKKKFLLFVSLLILLLGKQDLSAQVANAGTDQHIYLSQTSTVVLNGNKSSGSKFRWTDISTDYKCPGKIISPNEKITKITGLQQGVFYFQLAVSQGNKTTKDTTVVTVDYAPPPANARLVRKLEISNPVIYNYINNRHNTSQLSGSPEGVSTAEGDNFFDRARSNSMYIDREHKKFYSTIEDGYHWQSDNNYARTEVHWGSYWNFDTSKTYMIEWKGYFPQNFSYLARNQTVAVLMQIHPAASATYVPFGFCILNGIDGGDKYRGTPGVQALYFTDDYPRGTLGGYHLLIHLDSMFNCTHTIRLIMREGADAPLLEVEVDGVVKYIRTSGTISITPNEDYPKFSSLYDYGKALVDPTKPARGRKFSLVTESFRIYELKSENK